jgi:hypothetical protein
VCRKELISLLRRRFCDIAFSQQYPRRTYFFHCLLGSRFAIYAIILGSSSAIAATPPAAEQERMVEWTIESHKIYSDPFNDVDVDVLFSKEGQTWRVPAFWRGGQHWTVRFAPPRPGEYAYHLQSTDSSNPDLNGHAGVVSVGAYRGANELLRHGALQISANRRYFEYADGTPFFWLGDTWWTNLSSRLSWADFKELTVDRKAKGFTVIQIVGGLIPSNEEVAPADPGYCNEGGCVWDMDFKQINPLYFDYADRRIQHLIDSELAPAIVGGWNEVLGQMGVAKMKKHWRYLVARYGAYPVFWIVGGELYDPPLETMTDDEKTRYLHDGDMSRAGFKPGDWTDVTRYLRSIDPYHHPVTVHERPPPFDHAIQDESLTDFDLFQPGHGGWASIGTEVVQLDRHFARTRIAKPLVVGEIGYEGLFGEHGATFQRAAFWLSMLNGAAGFTYGTIETAEAYSADKPQRLKWSLATWQEAMNRPGSAQVGLNANLLRQHDWWQLVPHPEWIEPRGTTLLEPSDRINALESDRETSVQDPNSPPDDRLPTSEWNDFNGNFRLPYAAGKPDALRVIYLPYWGSFDRPKTVPTIFGLEAGVRYQTFYWDPASGVSIDLGEIARPSQGKILYHTTFKRTGSWTEYGKGRPSTKDGEEAAGICLYLANSVRAPNGVISADFRTEDRAGLLFRSRDIDNYVAAVYSPRDKVMYITQKDGGREGPRLGVTDVAGLTGKVRLTTEMRDGMAAMSITDGSHHYSSPIVNIENTGARRVGVFAITGEALRGFDNFELRKSPTIRQDEHQDRRLYDYSGTFRGELNTPGIPEWERAGFPAWRDYGKEKVILLDSYRPPSLLFPQDWVLIMQAQN